MIRIGFHTVDVMNPRDRTVMIVNPKGKLIFKGSAHIGRGSKIVVKPNAILELGDNFAVSATTQINCYHGITFGQDVQLSWDCLIMDSDTHSILDVHRQTANPNKKIIFGNKIWVGCRCTILKGTIIPNNCVIGACSFVSGRNFQANTIIAGHPARSIKSIGGWQL